MRSLLAALLVSTLAAATARAQRVNLTPPSLRQLEQAAPGSAPPPAPDASGVPRLDPETLQEIGLSPADLEKLQSIADLIKRQWVDGDGLDSRRLRDGAIRGMLQELDPYSEFFTPEQYEAFQRELRGSYGGIGAVLKKKAKGEGQGVQFAYPGSPLAEAGVLPGDAIVEIAGENVGPLTTDEVAARLKGDPGSQVALKLSRPDPADPEKEPRLIDVTVTRAELSSPNLFSEVLDGNVGYVYFNEYRDKDTEFAFEKAVRSLQARGVSRLVIDERGNPGGSVESVVKIAGLFLDKGQRILSTKDRRGNEKIAYAPADGPFASMQVKVLVDGLSASASEILAGALQDNRKARVVGSQTFGKGSAQALIPIEDVGAIKLTINKWYTPSGKSIQGVGITPDDPVPMTELEQAKVMTRIFQKLTSAPLDPPGPVDDPVLKKALQ